MLIMLVRNWCVHWAYASGTDAHAQRAHQILKVKVTSLYFSPKSHQPKEALWCKNHENPSGIENLTLGHLQKSEEVVPHAKETGPILHRFSSPAGPVWGAAYIKYLCPYDLYGPVRNVFGAGRYVTWASGRGLGPGNGYFWALWNGIELISKCHLGPNILEQQTVGCIRRTLRHIKLFAYPNLIRRPKTDKQLLHITFAGYFQDEEILRCLLRVFSFYAFSVHVKYTKYV